MAFLSRIRRHLQKFSKKAEKKNPFTVRGLEKFEKTRTKLAEKRELVAAKTATKASLVRFSPGCKDQYHWIPLIPSKSTRISDCQQLQDDASSSDCKDSKESTVFEATVCVSYNSEHPVPQELSNLNLHPKVDIAKGSRYVSVSHLCKIYPRLSFAGNSFKFCGLNQFCKQIFYRTKDFLITAYVVCVDKLGMLEMLRNAVGGFSEIFGLWQKVKFHTLISQHCGTEEIVSKESICCRCRFW